MRTFIAIFFSMLAGCVSGPSPQVREASNLHQEINRTMTVEQVYQVLGKPDRILEDGRQQWRVEDRDYFSELIVSFGHDGKILELEKLIGK